jgi:uncharacterized protein YjbI with pentapeptide repeats
MIEQLRQQILKKKNISNVKFTDEEIIPPEAIQLLKDSLPADASQATSELPPEYCEQVSKLLPVIMSGKVRLWDKPSDFSGKFFNNCLFCNLDMSQWDLTDTFFNQCVFDHVVLPGELSIVTIQNSKITDSLLYGNSSSRHKLKHLQIYDCEFSNTDLSHTDAEYCQFSTTTFEECKFSAFANKTKSEFYKCSFKNTDFRNSKLDLTIFEEFKETENLNFSGSSMKSAMITGLQISKDNLNCIDNCDLTCANMNQTLISGINPQNVVLNRTVFTESSFQGIKFEKQDLSCAWLSLCTIENCSFEHCNLSNTKFDGSQMKNVNISDCLASQMFADNIEFSCSCFNHCILDFASMNYARLDNSKFIDCSMKLVNIHDIKNTDSTMFDCDMTYIRRTDPQLYEAEHFY